MPNPDEQTTVVHGGPGGARLPGAGDRAVLVVYHQDVTKVVQLPRGGSTVVGRSWPADVVIPDPGLSRQHARFSWTDEGFLVEDLGSRNGTIVRGSRIERAQLGPGEEVGLGSSLAALHAADGLDAALQGIESHGRFMARLHEEAMRGRVLGRGFSLLMIEAFDRGAEHVTRFCLRVRRELREIDRMCVYGPSTLLVLLIEADAASALDRARRLVARGGGGEAALRCGVATYPADGLDGEALVERARTALQAAGAEEPARAASTTPPAADTTGDAVFVSESMRTAFELARRAAQYRVPVLVLGETGSGKELIAQTLHDAGPAKGPFRAVNCAAIPAALLESTLFGHEKGAFTGATRSAPGVFEQAHGGTVFLDEVGELPPPAQAALLRVLETRRVCRVGAEREIEVDARVVAATHRDLEAMARAGAFREDLLYRLNAMTIALPPLRERPEDVLPIARHLLARAREEMGATVGELSPEAEALLERYPWPGNVRELRNVLHRAVVVCRGSRIEPADLPEALRASATGTIAPPAARPEPTEAGDFKDRVKQYETDLIVEALERAGGNQTEAARLLQMPLRTLVHKLRTLGIKRRFTAG